MSAGHTSACEDRGADLLVAARGGAPPADLARHLESCGGCREGLESLRAFARDLRLARGDLRPRAATRAAVVAATAAAPAPRGAGPLAPPARRGRPIPFALPAAVAAAAAAAVWVALRPGPSGPGAGGAVEAAALFGGPGLSGIGPAGLAPGAVLESSRVAGVRLGAPVHAEVVLGPGTRIRIPAEGDAGRRLVLLAGAIFVEPGPGAPPPAGPVSVAAGDLEVEDRGARFSVERTGGGAAILRVATGVVVARSAGAERTVSGPCRVDVPEGGPPGEPLPAEASDATAWFAYPEISLSLADPRGGGGAVLAVALTPSFPGEIPIAPFHERDPLFVLVATHPERGRTEVAVAPRMLLAPPPAAGPDGAFLLAPARPYRIEVDAASLGLPPGRYRVAALYSASRPGGPWRGSRASNEVELEVR